MSDSPFRDDDLFGQQPIQNPYHSPLADSDKTPLGNPVLIPGIILLVLSGLFMLLLLATLPGQLVQLSNIDTSTPEGLGELTGGVVAILLFFVMTGAVILGSICMIRMKGYSGAVTAAMAAVVPCCSPFFLLGIPFGIWALIVLMRADVRAAFD
jgi:hypothetical protein